MNDELLCHYADRLDKLKKTHNYRAFRHTEHSLRHISIDHHVLMLNLASNDYLGIAQNRAYYDEFLASVAGQMQPLGSSSSRLLTGNFASMDRLEMQMQALFGRACLLFNSGYHANVGILPAICDGRTLILADKLVHASIIDGMRLAAQNGTKTVRYQHQNLSQLESLVQKYSQDASIDRIVVVTESIFSMDGDVTDLSALVAMKRRYRQLMLYVDEAHAIGVRGERGLGCVEEFGVIDEIDFIVGAFGKALASVGGYVICHEILKAFLINHVRPLIFSTALPPMNAAWTSFVLTKITQMNDARLRLSAMSDKLNQLLTELNLPTPSTSQIVPVIIGDNASVLKLAADIWATGYYVLPVRPPTVPQGQARLRICLNAGIGDDELSAFMQTLQQQLAD
ncbi:aminotransferase class I/II-fold pyridoxal phosphate-dependent enzyme [Moraxella sp. ZJ142]|uniref:aminotransferase class I/II-fold pyridoxal phosphate-dependent enzyme n=1 Tax=Moraxella marmotae TaxID=3344520 RepID=UPI0035D44A9B